MSSVVCFASRKHAMPPNMYVEDDWNMCMASWNLRGYQTVSLQTSHILPSEWLLLRMELAAAVVKFLEMQASRVAQYDMLNLILLSFCHSGVRLASLDSFVCENGTVSLCDLLCNCRTACAASSIITKQRLESSLSNLISTSILPVGYSPSKKMVGVQKRAKNGPHELHAVQKLAPCR